VLVSEGRHPQSPTGKFCNGGHDSTVFRETYVPGGVHLL
jgi:hypothetical protein